MSLFPKILGVPLLPIGKTKLSNWLISLISGPSINEVILPPAGITQLFEGFVNVNCRVELVFINPLVKNKLLLTSIAPPLFILRPALLLISRLLKALVPVKSPNTAPPTV